MSIELDGFDDIENPFEFRAFDKMARLNRECVITEKIDGTNAQILIVPDCKCNPPENLDGGATAHDGFVIMAGSRTRWVVPGKQDNAGFAGWVRENRADLLKLGPGRHFGEWWGQKIQRTYGLTEKRFSLFNVGRWASAYVRPGGVPAIEKAGAVQIPGTVAPDGTLGPLVGPDCCHVVPTIWRGNFDLFDARACLEMLRSHGSFAAPGFMKPEGIVIFHEAAKKCFKVTLEGDASPKSLPELTDPRMLVAGVEAAEAAFQSKIVS